MDELLIKYLLGETTPDETVRVEQWLAADAAHRERYEQFRAAWEISERNPVPAMPDAQLALLRLKQQLRAREAAAALPSARYRSLISWRAAAVFAAIACAGIITYLLLNRPGAQPSIAGHPEKTTPNRLPAPKPEAPPVLQTITAGSRLRIDTLPDGSVVTLHQQASIVYASGLRGSTRAVRLQGEAFFSVVRDAAKPFIVQANEVTVTVIGTSFHIRSIAGSTEVSVKTGAVKVTRGAEIHTLYAGQSVAFVNDTNLLPGKYKQLPKNNTQDSLRLAPVKKQFTGLSRATQEAQKNTARSIIDDLIKNKIVADKDQLNWFALDNRRFLVDGRTMPDSLHRAFVARYLKADSLGYYYGPRPRYVRGGGLCFDKKDLY